MSNTESTTRAQARRMEWKASIEEAQANVIGTRAAEAEASGNGRYADQLHFAARWLRVRSVIRRACAAAMLANLDDQDQAGNRE
jgi:hypothetical protein